MFTKSFILFIIGVAVSAHRIDVVISFTILCILLLLFLIACASSIITLFHLTLHICVSYLLCTPFELSKEYGANTTLGVLELSLMVNLALLLVTSSMSMSGACVQNSAFHCITRLFGTSTSVFACGFRFIVVIDISVLPKPTSSARTPPRWELFELSRYTIHCTPCSW